MLAQPEEARAGDRRRRSGRRTTRCSSPCARAPSSRCPGMMDTILNLGLNDVAVEGAQEADGERPVRVRQLPPLHPDVRQRRARDSEGRVRARARGGQEGEGREAGSRPRRSGAARGRRRATRRSSRRRPKQDFPQDPLEQLRGCARRRVPLVAEPARQGIPPHLRRFPTTSARPSTCRRWCSATPAIGRAPASASRATRRPARRSSTASS